MKYNIIYVDPPWKFSNKNTGGSMDSGSANKYPVLTLEQLKKLDVPSISDENCVLFLWWVSAMPVEALLLIQEWGFTLKTMTGFTWVKVTKNNKLHFGMGFWTRAGSENCLIALKATLNRLKEISVLFKLLKLRNTLKNLIYLQN